MSSGAIDVRRRIQRRRFRRRRLAALAILLVLLSSLTLLVLRVTRTGALPGIEVAGTDVGGLDGDELLRALTRAGADAEGSAIVVVREASGGEPTASRRYLRADAGFSVDAEATTRRVLERGRQGNPFSAFADHIRSLFGGFEVEPVHRVDHATFEGWVRDVGAHLAVPAVEGALTFDGTRVVPVKPRPGLIVDEASFGVAAKRALVDLERDSVRLPVATAEPATTSDDVEEAARRARRILDGPVRLTAAGRKAVLSPATIARTLATRVLGEPARLELHVRPSALERVARDELRPLESPPVDAELTLSGGSVTVVPGRPGFSADHAALADRLIAIALSKDRTGRLPGTKEPPAFTTAEARDLDVTEQVSSFTTAHSCCEPRVTNIHRIADMLDGTIVEPGETFSVNEAVGERTVAKGFVPAPAIFEGDYVEEVGGGISQFATTLFNAVFFGGYDFVEYKTHSYYISRYPAGREATLSWPSVDLAFHNDSDAGIYIDTSYTDTSITVTLYGNTNVEVTSRSGEPHNFKKPPVECEENRSLRKGETVVVQDGSRGFDIVVTRVFEGPREDERFFTRYLPEPRIVEKRSC